MIILHLEQYGWIFRRDVDLTNGNFHDFEFNTNNAFSNDANFELKRNAIDMHGYRKNPHEWISMCCKRNTYKFSNPFSYW
jgi:hypothetical protein